MMDDVVDLGILVFETHENFFIDTCRIANIDRHEITVFTMSSYFEGVEGDLPNRSDYTVISKPDDEPMRDYLNRVEQICSDRLDVLLVFPLHGHVLDFLRYNRFDPDCQTILTVYNVNTWTGTDLCFTPYIHQYLTIPVRKRIFSRMDAVLVEYPPIKDYLDSLDTGKPTYAFTPIVFEGRTEITDHGGTRVTIPGHVTESRRNYSLVLDAVERLPPEHRDAVELCLLGRPEGRSGKRILDRCDGLRDLGWSIRYFTDWISVPEFYDELERSDAILCPLYETRKSTGAQEVYGKSKGSGCLADGVRFGRPLVFPDEYCVPRRLRSSVLKYEDGEDLRDVILTLLGEKYEQIESEAWENAKQFTLNQQQHRFNSIIEDVVSF